MQAFALLIVILLSQVSYAKIATVKPTTRKPSSVKVISETKVKELPPANPEASLQTYVPFESPLPSLLERRRFEFGFGYAYVHYDEPGLMREFGSLGGVNGSLTQPLNFASTWIKAEADFFGGELIYDGRNNKGDLVNTKTQDYILNFRALFGNDFPVSYDVRVSPYAGLAYRYLQDDIKGRGGYKREIAYTYIPIGTQLGLAVGSNWAFIAQAEYDYFVKGLVKSHLSGASKSLPDIENEQNKGSGWRAAFNVVRRLSTNVLKVQAYMQSWKIEDSEVNLGFLEPANTSVLSGLNLSFEF